MQTVKQNDLPPISRNWRGEVTPLRGEIWKDKDGQHNLILETFCDDGEMCASILTLDSGTRWEHEPFGSWNEPTPDGLPYYRHLAG